MVTTPLPEGWTCPVLPESWDLWATTIRAPRTPTLYHYTSAEALVSIVTKKQMWATNLLYANDPAELKYARDVAKQAIESASEEHCGAATERQFLKKWLESFDEIVAMFLRVNDFYSISVCEDGDLLSQWRAYGALGGGFAMGWSATSKFPPNGRRASIEYRPHEQVRLVTETVRLHVEAALARGTLAGPADWTPYHDALTYSLAMQLNFYLYAFKHESYSSESELRFIYTVEQGKPALFDGPRVRRFGTMMKPYIVVDFSAATLSEVVYGAVTDSQLTERWLRLLLDANGYEHTTIRSSLVPMR